MNKLMKIVGLILMLSLITVANVSAKNPDAGFEPITICHATGNGSYNEQTIDNQGALNGHDGHGDDIIPAPEEGCPEGDEEEDVCPNIDGIQEEVPDGYVLDDGECVEEEEEPVDVCPNLDGVQEEIPDGYVIEDGQCVEEEEEPVDVCPNIEGNQAEVPQGYVLVDGQCVLSTQNVPGCTDSNANNYNPNANVNDNSCKYDEKKDDNNDDDDDDDDDNDSDDEDNNDDDDSESKQEETVVYGRGGMVLGASTNINIKILPNTSSR